MADLTTMMCQSPRFLGIFGFPDRQAPVRGLHADVYRSPRLVSVSSNREQPRQSSHGYPMRRCTTRWRRQSKNILECSLLRVVQIPRPIQGRELQARWRPSSTAHRKRQPPPILLPHRRKSPTTIRTTEVRWESAVRRAQDTRSPTPCLSP